MNRFLLLCFLAAAALSLTSCDLIKDDEPENKDATDTQKWIEKTLEDYYLWDSDVTAREPNYKLTDYEEFFESLLSTNRDDGRHGGDYEYFFSTIEEVEPTTLASTPTFESSFGIDFYPVYAFHRESSVVKAEPALILTYVRVGSPIWKAGLRRGDHIWKVNGKGYSDDTEFYNPLLYNLSSTLYWSRPVDKGEVLPAGTIVDIITDTGVEKGTLKSATKIGEHSYATSGRISAAMIEVSPILKDTTFVTSAGKTVGYLAYEQFERGNDSYYDDQLKGVFKRFKQSSIQALVIDLRYNPGGYVTSCNLMMSMVVSEAMEGQELQRHAYNNRLTKLGYYNKETILTLDEMQNSEDYIYGREEGVHLGMKRVYVIATEDSASASEALLHCLKGIGVEVIHVGGTTLGKNVGSSLFTSEEDVEEGVEYDFGEKAYEMRPIIFFIEDAKGKRYTKAGIAPTSGFSISEWDEVEFAELGEPKEVMLGAALYHIDNGTIPPKSYSDASYESELPTLSTTHFKSSRLGGKGAHFGGFKSDINPFRER